MDNIKRTLPFHFRRGVSPFDKASLFPCLELLGDHYHS